VNRRSQRKRKKWTERR